jgi:hypothetical protein
MKKAAFFFFLSLWLTACNNNTPTGIASKFLDCLVAKDYSRAKQYCTASGAMAISFIENMNTGEGALTGYKILRDSVVDDRAWVFYEGIAAGRTMTTAVELTKLDGKWKVDPKMRK